MLILGHRGASKYAPENTMPSIRKALELGVDGIELDVQLTRDKIPVVIHSDRLTPFTTTYTFVHATPFRALQTIDVGSPFHLSFAGERIPTLESVLQLLVNDQRRATSDQRPLLLNLELKAQPYWHFGLEERVVALVRQYGLTAQTLFSSFSPLVLWRLRRAAPEIRRALLIEPRAFFFLRARFFARVLAITHLHPFHETTTGELMQRARRYGWQVIAWTVNTRTEIERARQLGVDGIITDDPILAKQITNDQISNTK